MNMFTVLPNTELCQRIKAMFAKAVLREAYAPKPKNLRKYRTSGIHLNIRLCTNDEKETIERVFADAKEKYATRYPPYRGNNSILHRWKRAHLYGS